jgi:diaminohydroxyphosphoribosylaminopyrimidine deaminase/5-amino-6-(5-phosphoribosylamino)uracil reductase
VPATLRLFDGTAPTLVATTPLASDEVIASWEATGADVLVLDDDAGGVALASLLDALGKRDVQGVLVEGGATLAWSFVRDRLLDRIVVYLAPKLVGGVSAPGVVGGAGLAPITDALPLRFTAVTRVGPDLKVEADVQRDR